MILTIPVSGVEMSRHLTGYPSLQGNTLAAWQLIVAACTAVVVFRAGSPLIIKGWESFINRRLNMFSLIMPGILITFFYSLLALLFPGLFPDSFRIHGQIPVYFEAAAMITTLVLLGQYLEARAEKHTGDALESLAKLLPEKACVIDNGNEHWTPLDQLDRGDHIRLRAGERIPVDGIVISGEASIDESMLTGEPMPVAKETDDNVTGGTLVHDGTLVIVVDKTGDNTMLARIVQMVRDAQDSKAPIQRIADRVTGKLVPAVMLVAVTTVIVWWRIGPSPALWYGMLHGITVLMITCPCALGLATPVSIMTGLGRGALNGILIKNAASLEKLADAKMIVLDKTGTLTTGEPVLHACTTISSGDDTQLIQYAASLEHFSRHPLAMAITAGASKRSIPLLTTENFQSFNGKGVSGVVEGHTVLIGNPEWLADCKISDLDELFPIATQYERDGCSTAWVSIDGKSAGLLAVSDQLKPNTINAIKALKERGLDLAILTGDSEESAQYMARQSGISHVYANILPGEKAEKVASLTSSGVTTVMVGDGINDAPALATADVGIAIGTGTETARASGHIILTSGDLSGLVQVIDLSRAVMRNIKQNLFFAFAYNTIMIPIAAGVLFPATGLMLTPVLASVAMSASSITVISNALRLRNVKLQKV